MKKLSKSKNPPTTEMPEKNNSNVVLITGGVVGAVVLTGLVFWMFNRQRQNNTTMLTSPAPTGRGYTSSLPQLNPANYQYTPHRDNITTPQWQQMRESASRGWGIGENTENSSSNSSQPKTTSGNTRATSSGNTRVATAGNTRVTANSNRNTSTVRD